jgi:lipopolysaccharide export system permease protein
MGPAIIDRYVFREVLGAFLFCFGVFLVTGLIAGFLPLLQRGMEAGLTLTLILFQMLINALPSTLVTVLPLSITVGILLGLGRMAADNEIAAIKSSGVPVVRLLPPVLLLGVIGLLMSLFCTLTLIPRGIAEGRKLTHEALTTRADAGLEERCFVDSIKGLIIYVRSIDHSSGLINNIFIWESGQSEEARTIIARQGRVLPDPEGKALALHLQDGTLISENAAGETTAALAFESQVYRYPIEASGLSSAVRSLEEMSVAEIQQRVRDAAEKESLSTGAARDFYRRAQRHGRLLIVQRFSFPLACIALALCAFPLGVLNMGRSRLNNVSVGLLLIFGYYAFSLATERMARSGLAPPEIAVPLPPVVFSMFAVYFMRCVQAERAPALVSLLLRGLRKIRSEGY